MNTIYRFAEYDERITRECRQLLPNQPHVAAYIAGRLRSTDGSVMVARMLCEALCRIDSTNRVGQLVDRRRVDALAVDAHQERLGRLCAMTRRRDGKFASQATYFIALLVTCSNLAVKSEAANVFGAIYNCAHAMLIGIQSPTEVANVRETGTRR